MIINKAKLLPAQKGLSLYHIAKYVSVVLDKAALQQNRQFVAEK